MRLPAGVAPVPRGDEADARGLPPEGWAVLPALTAPTPVLAVLAAAGAALLAASPPEFAAVPVL